jgi:RimJ/RimL family protein N-acetyltransferase
MSWTVAPERRGTGVGSEIVASIVDRMPEPLRAEIKIDHVASRRIAEKAGLNLIAAAGEILVYYRGPA